MATKVREADSDFLLARAGPSGEVAEFRLDLSAKSDARLDHLRPDYLGERRAPLPVRAIAAPATGEAEP